VNTKRFHQGQWEQIWMEIWDGMYHQDLNEYFAFSQQTNAMVVLGNYDVETSTYMRNGFRVKNFTPHGSFYRLLLRNFSQHCRGRKHYIILKIFISSESNFVSEHIRSALETFSSEKPFVELKTEKDYTILVCNARNGVISYSSVFRSTPCANICHTTPIIYWITSRPTEMYSSMKRGS
jgi:hypothetical protein